MFPARFVVLHHTGIPQPHYDLLFELDENSPLAAARCSQWPPSPATQFQRIADHRRIYLEYEGEISGGRGNVKQIASGSCQVEMNGDDSFLLTFDAGFKLRISPRN
jgi:hypothetical protein